MRIIGGQFKGRRFSPPKNLPVRPTTDFAKEALFNIISHHRSLEGLDVLDLFSGTGNVSYEFLSRGCSSLISVETNFKCTRYIREVLTELNVKNATVVRSNVFSFLKAHTGKYDLIFADPPYDLDNKQKVVELIFENGCLNEEGWLVLEHPKTDDFSSLAGYIETRKYNRVNFSIFGYVQK